MGYPGPPPCGAAPSSSDSHPSSSTLMFIRRTAAARTAGSKHADEWTASYVSIASSRGAGSRRAPEHRAVAPTRHPRSTAWSLTSPSREVESAATTSTNSSRALDVAAIAAQDVPRKKAEEASGGANLNDVCHLRDRQHGGQPAPDAGEDSRCGGERAEPRVPYERHVAKGNE